MILFHGSDRSIKDVDLSKCRPFRDFGRGFYFTTSQKHAEEVAETVAIINGTHPVVNTFFFIIDQNIDEINIKVFSKPDEEWLQFVLNNRNNPDFVHNYDIVVGPMAKDGLSVLLRKYTDGLIDSQTLLERISVGDYSIRYCFCTEKAVSKLKKI